MHELSRREREKESRRKEILQAAWDIFATKDYSSATIDEIAEAAELSKGAIYLYFQNKAELFFATLEMGVEKFFAVVEEVISSEDNPEEGIKGIIKKLLAFFQADSGIFRILSSQRSHFAPFSDMEAKEIFIKRVSDIASRGTKLLVDYIQHGIDMGIFRPVDPEAAAFLLFEIVRGFAFGMIHGPMKFDGAAKHEDVISIVMDGIRAKDSAVVNQE